MLNEIKTGMRSHLRGPGGAAGEEEGGRRVISRIDGSAGPRNSLTHESTHTHTAGLREG